jgi:hypothetical protein
MNLERFKSWMKATTVEQKQRAADTAQTSVAHLYQLASGHRKASADLAARLESAIEPLDRGDIAEACQNCCFYQECKK